MKISNHNLISIIVAWDRDHSWIDYSNTFTSNLAIICNPIPSNNKLRYCFYFEKINNKHIKEIQLTNDISYLGFVMFLYTEMKWI